jgi:hypothetical protein
MASKYLKLKSNGRVILHNGAEVKNLMIAGQPVEYEVIPDEQILQDLIEFGDFN